MDIQIGARLDFNLPAREKQAMSRLARKLAIPIGVLLRFCFDECQDLLITAQSEARDNLVDSIGESGTVGFEDLAWESVGRSIAQTVDPAL